MKRRWIEGWSESAGMGEEWKNLAGNGLWERRKKQAGNELGGEGRKNLVGNKLGEE